MGLGQGLPESVPVVESDFIFSAISEELGVIFFRMSDPCVCFQLYYVCKYCHEDEKDVL